MKKLLFTFVLLAAACFFRVQTGHADDMIRLILDGKLLKPEVPPIIMNGSTMVPVRIITEELGATVSWDENARRVTVEKSSLSIELTIDRKEVSVNGSVLQLEAAPVIVNGNTLLPVRFLSEKMGVGVLWDGDKRSVFLYKPDESVPATVPDPEGTVLIPAGGSSSAAPSGHPSISPTPTPTPTPTVGSTTMPTSTPRPTPTPTPTPTATPGSTQVVQPSGSPSSSVGSQNGEQSSGPPPSSVGSQNGEQSSGPPTSVIPDRPGQSVSPTPSIKPGQATGLDPTAPALVSEVAQVSTDKEVLRILTTGKVEPSFIYLSNPDRLVVDLPNTALGPTINGGPVVQNGEIPSTHPLINKIRYSFYQDHPSTVRIVVDLKQKIDYTLLESKIPGEVAIALQAHRYKVVLDAGHGDDDPGAISVNGRYEKDFNLIMVMKIAKLLEGNPLIELRLTRNDDTFLELDERVELANDWAAEMFVSIHANKYSKPSVKGVETYYARGDSADLAEALHHHIVAAAGSVDRNVRSADYRVIKRTTMPAVLCEIGYLSNPEEARALFNDEVQDRIAASIAAGIREYLNIP